MIDKSRYEQLDNARRAVKISRLRDEIDGAIWGAYVNANDTVYTDKAIPENEWASCFKSSLEGVLACGELSAEAKQWFASKGVTW